jgi:DnaJ-class molecular chaperone
MRDPYQVLGVEKKASASDIKSAFRRLAKKLHPDANKQDADAATRFAELNAAYEILGDGDKRKAFDRGEIDAEGKPRFQGFGGGGGRRGQSGPGQEGFETFTWGQDGFGRTNTRGFGGGGGGGAGFEDILKDMFGGMAGGAAAGRARGARGGPTGGPRGGAPFETDFAEPPARGADISASVTITLDEAVTGASKRLRLPNGKDVDVKIPTGLSDGQQIRLKGQGYPSATGPSGDLLISVSIAPHSLFKVDGDDLRVDLPITLYEAVLGGKVRVPLLEGAVDLAIPPATNSGRTFRLRGKGMAKKGAKAGEADHGDLLLTVRLVLPDAPDADLEELMRKWRDTKPYDPRKDLG